MMERAGKKQAWIRERVEERCKQEDSCIWLAQVRKRAFFGERGGVRKEWAGYKSGTRVIGLSKLGRQ